MKNRVLIVSTTSYAGMGPYVSEIVNGFALEDDVFFFFHDYSDDYYKKNVKNELHERSVFFRHSNSVMNKLKWLVTNRLPYDKDVLRLCKEKKITLVHYINGFPSKRMTRKFRNLGIEVLGTVHDLNHHEMKKSFYKMWFQRVSRKRLLADFYACPHLITNSPSQYEELKKKYPQKHVTYHAFPSLVTPKIVSGNDVPKELINLEQPYILFFGRIESYKGIDLLVEAFSTSPELCDNYYLVIAGSGELRCDITRSNKIVTVNRYIKDSEIAYIYRNASAVVYPYISATQSGVLSLAFYFGAPTLASDVPFFKGIIKSEKVGLLFQRGNVDDLRMQLNRLLSQNRQTMAESQKAYFLLNYDAAAIRKNLLEIYKLNW